MKNTFIKIKIIFLFSYTIIINSILANPLTIKNNFANREDVKAFMNYMYIKHNFNLQQLENLFKKYSSNQSTLDKISNPSEKLSWKKYKQLLITHDRIKKGEIFLSKYNNILLKAERQFMIPKEIVVAILGIESFYGERSGNIPVIESLATLSFDYPPRKKFFRHELEQFLLLMKEESLDPSKIMGSYAGAMSPAQFISSSYRNYAIDFANIGSKDLNNMHNAIGSIANYLHKHGWVKGQPIASLVNTPIHNNSISHKLVNFINNQRSSKHKSVNINNKLSEANIDNKSHKSNHKSNKENKDYFLKYIHKDLSNPKPKYLLKKLYELGVKPKIFNNISNDLLNQRVSFIEFDNELTTKEYWVGFNNFYVISKYNHSINYAMAVYQLALSLGLKS